MNKIRRTIGSCGTGLAPIFTLGSAAVPPAFIVHAVLLSFIHVMYYTREETVVGQRRKNEEGGVMKEDPYPIVCLEPRLVLETVYGVATATELVTAVA